MPLWKSSPSEGRPRTGDVLCDRFKVVSRMGSGAQGSVYDVKDRFGHYYAAKISRTDRQSRELHENEVDVLHALQRHGKTPEVFPNVYFVGRYHHLPVLCMSLLHQDLFEVSRHRNFHTHTPFNFVRQILDRLETLHRHGFVHRDVKPNNFVIDREGKLHLVDFGMAKPYRDRRTGSPLPKRRETTLYGTLVYASKNTPYPVPHSRRDDLESLGYSSLINKLTGGLPWAVSNVVQMFRIKESTSLSKLCKRVPRALYDYMARITALSYSETPDYARVRSLFERN